MTKPLSITLFYIILLLTGFSLPAQNYSRLTEFPEYIRNSKPFQRFEWFYTQRAYPYDTIPYTYAARVADREIKKIKESARQKTTFTTWISKGPAGVDYTDLRPYWDTVSGRVKALAVHPTDPLTVYIGTASGGLWKTIDGGENWMDIGVDLPSLTYGAIAIDPNNPEVIYAGGGEARAGISFTKYGGRGLFKSTNGGSTWDTINAFGEYTVFTDIVVSTFDSDLVFASLASGPFNLGAPLPNEGIWKSSDAGENWGKKLDLPSVFDVMLHPTDPNIVYACIGGMEPTSGFYISTDQGETWNPANNGLPAPGIIRRMQMDISPSNPDVIYAVVHMSADTLGPEERTRAYKTSNGGSNWIHISPDTPLGGYGNGWYDQGWYDLCIAIDPLNSDHVFIGNVELHETTDGQNFSPVRYPGGTNLTHSIAHNDYHQLKFALSDPNFFYIGCDGGVYLSTDSCNSSEHKNNGLETIQLYRMDSHPSNPNIMIGGTQDNGTMMTTDGGDTWEVVAPGDGMECFFDRSNPDSIIYASNFRGFLMKSTDGGNTFYLLKNVNGAWVTPFFAHPHGPDTLYSANTDIQKLSNGLFFLQITSGLSQVLINTMAQSRANPQHMILAGNNNEFNTLNPPDYPVMISTDGGYTWTDVTAYIPGDIRWISRVVTHPWDENTMFIVRCGFSEGNKIYKTTDLGEPGQTFPVICQISPVTPCGSILIFRINILLGQISGFMPQTMEAKLIIMPVEICLWFPYKILTLYAWMIQDISGWQPMVDLYMKPILSVLMLE